jgi:hypothetical protein
MFIFQKIVHRFKNGDVLNNVHVLKNGSLAKSGSKFKKFKLKIYHVLEIIKIQKMAHEEKRLIIFKIFNFIEQKQKK